MVLAGDGGLVCLWMDLVVGCRERGVLWGETWTWWEVVGTLLIFLDEPRG